MQHPGDREGIIKYTAEHVRRPLDEPAGLVELLRWRPRLYERRLIGADQDGLGYGNLSVRLHASPRFLISGTQTSGLAAVHAGHFAEVTAVDLDRNDLKCVGEVQASSEAMTHAALYQADPAIRAVVHVHSRRLWERHRGTLPTTREEAAYGTPEMAYEVIRLYRRGALAKQGVFVMGGHPEGMIAFGRSMAEAAGLILELDAAASV